MKVAFHSVEKIGSPFWVVDEYLFAVPSSGHHLHNEVGKIIFVFQGSCYHETELGERVRVPLDPGDILVLPQECDQHYLPLRDGESTTIHALRLAFDPAELPPLAPRHRRTTYPGDTEADLIAFVRHHFQEVRHLPQGQNAAMREALGQLQHEAECRLPGYRFRVRALCISLLIQVARQCMDGVGEEAVSGGTSRAYRVHQVKEYIIKHLDQPLSLARIAAHAASSEEHLARTFKQVTGQTVFDYLRQMRLEQAKTYLVNSPCNASEIARLTGFGSLSLFSRNFKKYVGMSPMAYRQHLASDLS